MTNIYLSDFLGEISKWQYQQEFKIPARSINFRGRGDDGIYRVNKLGGEALFLAGPPPAGLKDIIRNIHFMWSYLLNQSWDFETISDKKNFH